MSSPLITIVGSTASGKSDLAMFLAKKYNGEIIAADSRTVYRHMDIGTAKPSGQDQHEIKHHLLDVVDPDQPYSAADFKRAAEQAIQEINSNGKLPIMVGGTGLYIDSVLFNYSFAMEPDIALRQKLASLSAEELQKRVVDLGVHLNHSDFNNPHRLIRAIETAGLPRQKSTLRANTLVLGLKIDRDELRERIVKRIGQMFNSGLESEIDYLLKHYSKESPGLADTAYQALISYREGRISKQEAKSSMVNSHADLAKRQMTWFKRNSDINWVSKKEEADLLVSNFLERL